MENKLNQVKELFELLTLRTAKLVEFTGEVANPYTDDFSRSSGTRIKLI